MRTCDSGELVTGLEIIGGVQWIVRGNLKIRSQPSIWQPISHSRVEPEEKGDSETAPPVLFLIEIVVSLVSERNGSGGTGW